MKFKKLKKSDWPKVLLSFLKSLEDDFDYYSEKRKKYLKNRWQNREVPQGITVWNKNNLVGFLIFKDYQKYSWGEWAWVNKDYRGQGLGERLVRKWQKKCQKKGIKTLKLRSSNQKAWGFYKKTGFKLKGKVSKNGLTFGKFEGKL